MAIGLLWWRARFYLRMTDGTVLFLMGLWVILAGTERSGAEPGGGGGLLRGSRRMAWLTEGSPGPGKGLFGIELGGKAGCLYGG
jgi:hypothetical protein